MTNQDEYKYLVSEPCLLIRTNEPDQIPTADGEVYQGNGQWGHLSADKFADRVLSGYYSPVHSDDVESTIARVDSQRG